MAGEGGYSHFHVNAMFVITARSDFIPHVRTRTCANENTCHVQITHAASSEAETYVATDNAARF